MPRSVEELALELLELPASSRALLASKLIASLDDTEDADVDPFWIKEAERRSQEIREGKVTCFSMEEVLREARSELDQ